MPTLPAPIIIKNRLGDDVWIHTFIAAFTDNNIANSTHIIESNNVLVLIDGQFLSTYATQFREYADSLGKPIDRLYLSHRHPDHWFGLGTAFRDVPIYALKETITFLRTDGEASRLDHVESLIKLGDHVPDEVVIPENVVRPGVASIDGITYVFDNVIDTEIDFLLTIRLPDLKVYIPQDLIYSGTHLYLTKEMKRWITVLDSMLNINYELFLPGHGRPAGKEEVFNNMEYLTAAQHAYDSGLKDADFKQFLLDRYPARLCPGVFDIYVPRLFDGASDY